MSVSGCLKGRRRKKRERNKIKKNELNIMRIADKKGCTRISG